MSDKAHADLSASGSSIWLNCPGAPNLWLKAPEKEDNKYSLEGTEAHDLLEKWAKHEKNKKGFFRAPAKYSPGMVDAVGRCIHEMRKHWSKDDKTKELVIEEKVDISEIVGPDMWGTVDLGIVHLFKRLTLIDYKHGSGVKVEAFKTVGNDRQIPNTQLIYYALGLAHRYHFNFEDVELIIVQPRYDKYQPTSRITITIEELMYYIEYFKEGVKKTKDKKAPRRPGEWCRFCKAKSICKETKEGYRTDSREDF